MITSNGKVGRRGVYARVKERGGGIERQQYDDAAAGGQLDSLSALDKTVMTWTGEYPCALL
jgi:hypothetical protein